MGFDAAELREGDALIIVDVQRDFLPGGSLAVAEGDAVVPVLNRVIDAFVQRGLPVFATRDWHPTDHCSFRAQGGPWPPHCVVGTPGAEFAPALRLPESTEVISKGARAGAEGYSGFEETELARRLRERGCRRLFIGGLATDYCVRATALEALREGFEVVILEDAVRAVDERTGSEALAELAARGAQRVHVEATAP